MWWAAATALATEAPCLFTVDGLPVERLDCEAGGAWRVTCPLPPGRSGKVRVRLDALGIAAEARVPLAEKGEPLTLSIGGPGGRAGQFVVDHAVAGMLPGQAVGPNQLCPFVQPDVPPGSARVERPLTVAVTVHLPTGFAEEPMEGGVLNRVPTYDAGTPFASGTVPTLQRRVGDIPILTGTTGLPKDDAVRGQLQLAGPDGAWRSLGWSGRVAEIPLDRSVLNLLVLDFVAPEVQAATGEDPARWVELDLVRWIDGDPSSFLGLAAYRKSNLQVPLEGSFGDIVVDGKSWRRFRLDRVEIGVRREGDRLRAAVAWQSSPFDGDARKAVEAAFAAELGD